VPEVIDLETGRIYPVGVVFSQGSAVQHKQRMADETARLRGGTTRYHCPLCLAPLSVRAFADRTFYFRHPNDPDAQCPYRYDHNLSPEQINAMKYDGAKESARHRAIKAMLKTSLLADKSIPPESVQLETTVRALEGDWREWRRPDVQASWKNKLLALEIQLSTTFLTVIAGRREFYQRNGALLLWIFDAELAKEGDMRFTERDVFYNNNSNLFYVTPDTVANSMKSGEVHLMCRWEEPVIRDSTIHNEWKEQEVTFSQLQPDYQRQRLYYFDYDKALAERQMQLEASEARALEQRSNEFERFLAIGGRRAEREGYAPPSEESEALRFERIERERALAQRQVPAPNADSSFALKIVDPEREYWIKEEAFYRSIELEYGMPSPYRDTSNQFGNFWIRAGLGDDAERRQCAVWHHYAHALWDACPSLDIEMPERMPRDYRQLLCALYSLREGDVIGLEYRNLRSVENLVFNSYRHYYRYFAFAIRAYGREDELKILQPGSTCYRHIAEYKANRQKTGYIQDRDLDPLIDFLFPELRVVKTWSTRASDN
jgi:competence CoiA-like predicted nuclease